MSAATATLIGWAIFFALAVFTIAAWLWLGSGKR